MKRRGSLLRAGNRQPALARRQQQAADRQQAVRQFRQRMLDAALRRLLRQAAKP